MNETLFWILGLLIPAVLTVLGNLIFYKWIKKGVDESIEESKIAYSGVFREKIEIYRDILDKSYSLKLKIHRYHVSGDQTKTEEIFVAVEEFINFYLKNQPFLSKEMVKKLKKINTEFQSVLDNSYYYYTLSNVSGIEPKDRVETFKAFIEVGNKLKDKTFLELEELIISEMRVDLKTDK
jgi:hypothetical protein